MVKYLALFGFDQGIENAYKEQIGHFFRDSIVVQAMKWGAESSFEKLENGRVWDLVLIPSHLEMAELEKLRLSGLPFIVADRTLSRRGLELIQQLGSLPEVGILDRTKSSAMEMVTRLCQLRIEIAHFVAFEPADFRGAKGIKPPSVLIQLCDMGSTPWCQGNPKELNHLSVIDLQSSCLLDINSLSDISERLGLDHLIRRQSLQDGYQEIVTFNFGLSWISGQANQYERQLDMLLQVVEDGIVAVTTEGTISSYNRQACQILNCQFDDLMGKNGRVCFPEIPFSKVLNTQQSIREALVTLGGRDVVLSVEPINHSGKFYGAVAIFKSYSDLETRQHKLRSQLIGKGHKAKYHFGDLIGKSEILMRCKEIGKRMAASESSVLISGESGTGKELFAQAIHHASRRKAFQFVAINCGAMPENLLESELFGYEDGAFTGAKKGGKPGLLELAHKGTLFLDEVGEMPANLQMRLLRVLQEKEVMRVGGDRVIPVDLRIVAATNKNLKERVLQGHFREDLYYRINVLPLMLPPLSNRREDIPVLMAHFQHQLKSYYTFTPEAHEVMMKALWRGNIRELRNCMEYLAHLGIDQITVADLPHDLTLDHTFVKREEAPQLELGPTHSNNELWILKLLAQHEGHRRLGRRSLSVLCKEQGRYLSEQEIRSLLLSLQKQGFVSVNIGRGGTKLTEKGRQWQAAT